MGDRWDGESRFCFAKHRSTARLAVHSHGPSPLGVTACSQTAAPCRCPVLGEQLPAAFTQGWSFLPDTPESAAHIRSMQCSEQNMKTSSWRACPPPSSCGAQSSFLRKHSAAKEEQRDLNQNSQAGSVLPHRALYDSRAVRVLLYENHIWRQFLFPLLSHHSFTRS